MDLGIYTRLRYVAKHTAQELVWSVDQGLEITLQTMYGGPKRTFHTANGIPTSSIGGGPPGGRIEIRRGTWDGGKLAILYGLPGSPDHWLIAEGFDEVGSASSLFSSGPSAARRDCQRGDSATAALGLAQCAAGWRVCRPAETR